MAHRPRASWLFRAERRASMFGYLPVIPHFSFVKRQTHVLKVGGVVSFFIGRAQAVEVIRPLLHHFFAFLQIAGVVIRGAHAVFLAMGQLAFDPVAVVAPLIEQGGGHGAETVE